MNSVYAAAIEDGTRMSSNIVVLARFLHFDRGLVEDHYTSVMSIWYQLLAISMSVAQQIGRIYHNWRSLLQQLFSDFQVHIDLWGLQTVLVGPLQSIWQALILQNFNNILFIIATWCSYNTSHSVQLQNLSVGSLPVETSTSSLVMRDSVNSYL